jgi:hypothetical protein
MTEPATTLTPSKAAPFPAPPVDRRARSLIPVSLNEASLDSPSFRAAAVHFGDQIESVERWLDSHVRSTSKLVHDILGLEDTINTYLQKAVPSPTVIDGVVDTDHTLLALKRVGDGSREWWTQVLSSMRRMDAISIDPIRHFVNGDLRNFKEARRMLEQTQKAFDGTLSRFVSITKTKEPSAIREDAFTVYETRKSYLKAAMDYCQLASQLRYTLDKLLVRVSADTWREMKRSRDSVANSSKRSEEMERLRGWSKELEASEGALKKELQVARREIGENTLASVRPSRELEDYSASTVPFLGSRGPLNVGLKDPSAVISEKQGWLFLRTVTGKPARVSWTRRWYYCRDGIFGWLVQGPQGVLQGDEIGVLLCNAKPAVQEERRFCFEVKTKSQTLLLQAETQNQLTEWLEVFEVAKKDAFESTMGRDQGGAITGGFDPAFAITPPSMPEFSVKSLDYQLGLGSEESSTSLDRSGTLPVPGPDGGFTHRASFDVTASAPRRAITTLVREEGESSREHAARIMQKLDLHRKPTFGAPGDVSGPTAAQQPAGGIASLISASHSLLPGYGGYTPSVTQLVPSPRVTPASALPLIEPRQGTLAPSTLAKPPTTTTLSKAAVIASRERSLGGSENRGLPTAILANYWGSNLWGNMYSPKNTHGNVSASDDDPFYQPTVQSPASGSSEAIKSPISSHRKTISVDVKVPDPRSMDAPMPETFPPRYPPELKEQHAQFRLLFPKVSLEEKVVLVFNAAWTGSSADSKATASFLGSGRVFVTPDNMYFYGVSMGLVVAYPISLDIITEVTAAAGRDCDHIYLRLGEDMNETGLRRIDIRTFLEDVGLLHARLNLLIDNLQAEEPMDLSEIIDALIHLESEDLEKHSPSADSWEEIPTTTPIDNGTAAGRPAPRAYELRHSRSGRNWRKGGLKLQLPAHAVDYEPDDMQNKVAERHFEISAKACFHVLFGDKSFIFPKLYFERHAKEIAQGPWELGDHGKMKRSFRFKVDYVDMLGRKKHEDVADQQSIDVFSDHVTYVVTHVKTPWHLPHSQAFKLVTKVVITHVAKSKCKLAVFTKVDWSKAPAFSKSLVERQALDDAGRDAEELAEVATDQVRKLGPHSRTKRAIQVYGNIGQQTQVVIFTPGENESSKKAQIDPRTLTDMLFETIRSFMESVASSLMMWSFAGAKRIFGIVTANRVILLFLGLSILTNLMLTSRETSTWWTERRAAKFMSRIGVGPNALMSKAVYLSDLEAAGRGSGTGSVAWPTESIW